MDLNDIIRTANAVYPDDLIAQAAADFHRREGIGDGLAEFIARELRGVFDDSFSFTMNVEFAATAIHRATREVRAVENALEELGCLLRQIDETKREDLPLLIGTFKNPVAEKYLEQKIKEA